MTSDQFKRQRFLVIGVLLFCLVAPYPILYYNSELAQSQSICPVKLMTGMPCPGCGMLKSWAHLTHGDLNTSLDYHLFGPGAYLATIMLVIWLVIELWQSRAFKLPELVKTWTVPPIAVGLSVYHLIRLVDILMTPGKLGTLINEGLILKLAKATVAYFST